MPSGSQLYRSSGTKLQGKRQKYACNRGSVSRFVALASAPGYLPDETGRNPLASTAELPLLGKRIIVTGGLAQSANMAAAVPVESPQPPSSCCNAMQRHVSMHRSCVVSLSMLEHALCGCRVSALVQ
jgi:hypothetical protein